MSLTQYNLKRREKETMVVQSHCHFTASGADWHKWQLRKSWMTPWVTAMPETVPDMDVVRSLKDLKDSTRSWDSLNKLANVGDWIVFRTSESIGWKANSLAPLLLTVNSLPRSQFLDTYWISGVHPCQTKRPQISKLGLRMESGCDCKKWISPMTATDRP